MQPANLMWRALAAIVDGVLFGILLGLISGFAAASGSDATDRLGDPEDFGASLLVLAGYSAYYLVFEALTGTSPGKRIFRMRVVTLSGERIDASAAFLRNVLRPVDSLFFYLIGILSALFSPQRQRLGDRLAHTMVVRRARTREATEPEASQSDDPVF